MICRKVRVWFCIRKKHVQKIHSAIIIGISQQIKEIVDSFIFQKEDTTDRVAEFVDKTSGYATNYDHINVSSDSQSEASSPSMLDSAPTYQFFMNQRHRETFLSLFTQAKNRLSGKGFCYDETDNTNFSRFKTWHLVTKAELDD